MKRRLFFGDCRCLGRCDADTKVDSGAGGNGGIVVAALLLLEASEGKSGMDGSG